MRLLIFSLAIFAVLAASPTAQAAEFPLELKQFSSADLSTLHSLPGGWGQLMTRKDNQIKNEPEAASPNPIYGVAPPKSPGEKSMWLRLDESRGAGGGYDRLILDMNRNGDLTDDPVVKSAKTETHSPLSQMTVFGPFEMKNAEQGPVPLTLFGLMNAFNLKGIGQSEYNTHVGYFSLLPACYLQTVIDVEGYKERIAFIDGDRDMRIGGKSYAPSSSAADMMLRDSDKSGEFDIGLDSGESEALKEIAYFNGKPYRLALAENLQSVDVAPFDGPMGELASRGLKGVAALTLGRKSEAAGWETLDPHPSEGRALLPVGTYRLHSVSISGQDEAGRKWTSQGAVNSVKNDIEVAEGETSPFPVGEPFELKISTGKSSDSGKTGFLGALAGALSGEVAESVESGKKMMLSVKIVGAGGETYSRFLVDGKPAEAPRFVVQDGDGNQVGSGQFEYG